MGIDLAHKYLQLQLFFLSVCLQSLNYVGIDTPQHGIVIYHHVIDLISPGIILYFHIGVQIASVYLPHGIVQLSDWFHEALVQPEHHKAADPHTHQQDDKEFQIQGIHILHNLTGRNDHHGHPVIDCGLLNTDKLVLPIPFDLKCLVASAA